MNKVEQFFDALAANWDLTDDHSLEEKRSLLDKIKIKKSDEVLDVACGTGVISGLLYTYSKCDVLGVDISSGMIEVAKKKYQDNEHIHFLHQDVLTMDESRQFDVIVIYNAYPHFLNPNLLSEKLSKLLKKNGKVAILHSLSRKALCQHHAASANQVSRDLLSPKEEFEFFKTRFIPVLLNEDDVSYTFIVQKK